MGILAKRRRSSMLALMLCSFVAGDCPAQVLAVTPKGVDRTDIKLIPLFGDSALRNIAVASGIRSGQTAILDIPPHQLPGEFVVRYDYRTDEKTAPYPSEQRILIGIGGAAFSVDPVHAATPDSVLWIQPDNEDPLWRRFRAEAEQRKAGLNAMRAWLEQETDTRSPFHRRSVRAFDKRRKGHNAWVDSSKKAAEGLFISHLMPFAYEAPLTWKGSDPAQQAASHLSVINLRDTMILRSTHFKSYLDRFILGVVSGSKSQAEAGASILKATDGLLDDAANGHRNVQAWMVDYVYEGFASSGLDEGIPLLAQRLVGLEGLSKHADAILRKTAAMGRLQSGMQAPEILIPVDRTEGIPLKALTARKPLTLLLFWSATCSHCTDLVARLGPFSKDSSNSERLQVVAVSVDTEPHAVEVWTKMKTGLPHWIHGISKEGVRGESARAFGVLATPQMVLLEGTDARIAGMPATMEELMNEVRAGPMRIILK